MAAGSKQKSRVFSPLLALKGIREKRGGRRRKTSEEGVVVFGAAKIKCAICDLNDAGARIFVADAPTLPARIELQISGTGERRRATVVWRTPGEAGLSFNAARRGG